MCVEKKSPKNTQKALTKKKLSHQKMLSNSTWQHPSTLLGHTSSVHSPNPPLSLNPLDDPVDIFDSFGKNPNTLFDPYPNVSDNSDIIGFPEGNTLPPPRNLSVGVLNSRFVALKWQEPDISNADVFNYLIYYKQEGFERYYQTVFNIISIFFLFVVIINQIFRERIERTLNNEPTVTIHGLQPGTPYVFRAVANISNALSASSNVLKLVTNNEVSA